MKTEIRMEEWLSALEEADKGPDGFTRQELSARLGVGRAHAANLIQRGVTVGVIEFAGRRWVQNVAGCRAGIPVYRVRKSK